MQIFKSGGETCLSEGTIECCEIMICFENLGIKEKFSELPCRVIGIEDTVTNDPSVAVELVKVITHAAQTSLPVVPAVN